MKKIFLLLMCFATTIAVAHADDIPVSINQLPANAKQFIDKYFASSNISYAKMDTELFDKSYEVVFVDGSKVEFDKQGEWKDVDCKFAQVPAGIVPQAIQNYVATNHQGTKITEIDRDSRDYEVKLSNGLELKFNLKFNIIGIDD